MKDRTILHSDVNNFFASVESVANPKLKGKPVAVAGNPEKRTGIILAKNEIAKSFGVKTGEAIWQAKQKCADLVCVGPHYGLYEKISKKLHALYLNYTDFVEPLGLDECWLDITDSLKYLGKNGKEVADEIREKVKKEFGFTVSIGVSFSKIFAKLGSDLKKPDATTVINRNNFKDIVYPLPLNSVVGFGRKLTEKLKKMNIITVGDFVSLNENFVKETMGKVGVELHQKLSGKAIDKVSSYYSLTPPKSVGNGTTTIKDITNQEDLFKVIAFLSEKIGARMSVSKVQGSTISVSLKTNTFKRFHHSKTIYPIQTSEEIFAEAVNLVKSFWDFSLPIRAIRINMSNLKSISSFKQLSLFNEAPDKLESAINKVNEKYGKDKIYIASDTSSFINRKNEDEQHK